MTYEFRAAKREGVGLFIGLAGPTGSGKTMSAMRLAQGIVGPDKPFAVIDTESRRALHYADMEIGGMKLRFDHCELRAPFSPDAYAEAIKAADAAGYGAVVVDSFSHVWSGDGGVLDMQEHEIESAVARQKKMADEKGWRFDEYKAREASKMSSWIRPKMAHKSMVSTILQARPHLIFCMRAEEKMLMTSEKDEQTGRKKTVIVAAADRPLKERWQPICEKNFPFEMTVSFLLTHAAPGVGIPLKLQEQHKAIFPDGKLIDQESGKRLTAWAGGGDVPHAATSAATQEISQQTREPAKPQSYATAEAEARKGTPALHAWWSANKPLQRELEEYLPGLKAIAAAVKVATPEEIPFDDKPAVTTLGRLKAELTKCQDRAAVQGLVASNADDIAGLSIPDEDAWLAAVDTRLLEIDSAVKV